MRSINTTVVAVLPVGAILFIGAFWLGAETLSDISLSIFVGIIVAAYSTLFVAAPLYSLFRENEPTIKARDAARARRARARPASPPDAVHRRRAVALRGRRIVDPAEGR